MVDHAAEAVALVLNRASSVISFENALNVHGVLTSIAWGFRTFGDDNVWIL